MDKLDLQYALLLLDIADWAKDGDLSYELQDKWQDLPIFKRIKKARDFLAKLQECTCLPDLPDGRINGGRGEVCPACKRWQEKYDEGVYGRQF